MAQFLARITIPQNLATLQDALAAPEALGKISAVKRFVQTIVADIQAAYVEQVASADDGVVVAATGSVVFGGLPVADETMVVAGVTFTAKASGATGAQFNIGGTATITAQNFKAAVNALASTASLVVGSGSGATITLTSRLPGVAGNGLILTESMTNVTVVAFSGGSGVISDAVLSLLNGTSDNYGVGKASRTA